MILVGVLVGGAGSRSKMRRDFVYKISKKLRRSDKNISKTVDFSGNGCIIKSK